MAQDGVVTPEDRKRYLAKIHSSLFWVGRFIPEEEEVEGKTVPLRDLIFRWIGERDRSDEEIRGALSLASKLECKAREMEDRIKEEDISREEAERLLDHILGLMRAVNELRKRGGEGSEIRLQALTHQVDDQRRWLEFVKGLI
ncbi:MAG: DUF5788 family protein [Methanomassiliicoccales archaeon]